MICHEERLLDELKPLKVKRDNEKLKVERAFIRGFMTFFFKSDK